MDAQQFDTNVLAQIESIRRIGRKRLRRSFDLDDFTQEVIIRLYANRDQLRDDARLASWVAVSARNLAVKWNQKRAPILMPALPDPPVCLGIDEDPALLKERWQALVDALNGLDEVERDLLVSYYVDEVGYAELQQRHGLSYSAIGVRLHRAKRKLRKRLGWLVVAIAAFFRAPQHRAFGAQPMTTSRMSMVFIAGVATTITGAVIFGWAMSGTADATPAESEQRVIAVETQSLAGTDDITEEERRTAHPDRYLDGSEAERQETQPELHHDNGLPRDPIERELHQSNYPLMYRDDVTEEERRAAYPELYNDDGSRRSRNEREMHQARYPLMYGDDVTEEERHEAYPELYHPDGSRRDRAATPGEGRTTDDTNQRDPADDTR